MRRFDMNCVILQPSYIPWRGYFHQIQMADVFVFYDDVQYDNRGWRNRNRVKTDVGPRWLTIPVHHRGAQSQGIPIKDIPICWGTDWRQKHWRTLVQSYSRAPFFGEFRDRLDEVYRAQPALLADFTISSTITIAKWLGITDTVFLRASELKVSGTKTDRVLNILHQLKATHFINGPSAKEYTEEEKFQDAGITIEYMKYHYPAYPQLHPPLDANVSILDLLFMIGPDVGKFIWSPNNEPEQRCAAAKP